MVPLFSGSNRRRSAASHAHLTRSKSRRPRPRRSRRPRSCSRPSRRRRAAPASVLVTCIRNFRGSRGPVSGVLKGFVGLSTAIFTDLCSALFADDPASFLVMLAVIPAAVCAVAMVFLREGRVAGGTDDEADARGFAAISTLAVAIALYLLAADLTGIGSDGGPVSVLFITILLVLLAAPIAVPALVGWRSWMKTRKAANTDDPTSPLLLASKPAAPRREERHKRLAMLAKMPALPFLTATDTASAFFPSATRVERWRKRSGGGKEGRSGGTSW